METATTYQSNTTTNDPGDRLESQKGIEAILDTCRFAEKFKEVFPELKTLAQKAYGYDLDDKAIDTLAALMKQYLGDDLYPDAAQFCCDWADR